MYLIYFLNIDILALNIDIKLSYFSRIQTEPIKQMVAGEDCCGRLCRMVLGHRAGGLMISFLGSWCTTKFLWGARGVDGGKRKMFKWDGGY